MARVPRISPDRTKANGVERWLRAQIRYYEKVIEEETAAHKSTTPIVHENYFPIIIGFSILLMIIYAIVVYTMVPSIIFREGPLPVNPQLFAYLLIPVYILVSFRSVGVDEVAGADFFGMPVRQFSNGLKWVPFGLLHFQVEKATFVQSEFPGDADHIQWSDEKTPLEPGKVRPIYLLTNENPDGSLPTDVQMNIGIAALAKFQLVPERLFDLIKNVGPIDRAKEDEIRRTMTGGENVSRVMLEIVRHLRDTSTAEMVQIAGQMSYNEIRGHLQLINELLFLRLHKTLVKWGVHLMEAEITKLNPGHDFNEAIQARGRAKAERDAVILRAEGKKRELILEGEGAATARRNFLEAEAKGYAKIAKEVQTEAGQIAISAETAGKLAAAGNTVVVGTDGVRDLIGLVTAARKAGEK